MDSVKRPTREEFRERLKHGGWSHRALAASMDPPVTEGAVSRWASGERNCPPYICLVMDVVEKRVPREMRRGKGED